MEVGSQGFRCDKDSIGICVRDHSCYILIKNVAAFCPWPENLDEAEFKNIMG